MTPPGLAVPLDLKPWTGVAAGALMAVASVGAFAASAPEPVAHSAGFAAVVLLLLTWPRGRPSAWDEAVRQYAALRELARQLGLDGPVAVGPDGRLFFGMPGSRGWPPLDDGRSLYDGGDGHPAGIAMRHPCGGILDEERAREPERYGDLGGLAEALQAARGHEAVYDGFRVLSAPAGQVRYRLRAEPDRAALAHAFVALVAAAASGRTVRLEEVRDVEGDREGVLAVQERP